MIDIRRLIGLLLLCDATISLGAFSAELRRPEEKQKQLVNSKEDRFRAIESGSKHRCRTANIKLICTCTRRL